MNTTACTPEVCTPALPVEQLTLLPVTSTPARFRLSKDTRERGLRHVAEIRQMLAARTTTAAGFADVSQRHDRAA